MQIMTDPVDFRNDRFLHLITHKKFRIYRHIFLIMFFAAVFLNSKEDLTEPVNTFFKVAIFSLILGLFYFNMYWLIPRYIFTAQYITYFLWILGLLGITLVFFFTGRHYLQPYFITPLEHGPIPASRIFPLSFIFLIFIASTMAIKLFQRSIVINQRLNELESMTMHAELEQLKNQINPHFLFNTLNNVNVLTQINPEKASQVIMKLSDLLHYQLHDSTMNKVLLTADISFLEDFLNLEMIRRDNFEFEINVKGDIAGVLVPPLLFITFVENAVKHNLDAENPSYVYIFFEATEKGFSFDCINSKPFLKTQNFKKGGLGLVNVKRRLELLFPDQHYLYIDDKQEQFRVELKLNV